MFPEKLKREQNVQKKNQRKEKLIHTHTPKKRITKKERKKKKGNLKKERQKGSHGPFKTRSMDN